MSNNHTFWISAKEMENLKKLQKAQDRRFIAQIETPDKMKKRYEKNTDNRKWAWIRVGQTKQLVFVDKFTNKAYKAMNMAVTWMEIPRYTFLRWATSFDL